MFKEIITPYLINIILRIQYNNGIGLTPLNDPKLNILYTQLKDALIDPHLLLKTMSVYNTILPEKVKDLIEFYRKISWGKFKKGLQNFKIPDQYNPIPSTIFLFIVLDILACSGFQYNDTMSREVIRKICQELLQVTITSFEIEQRLIISATINSDSTEKAKLLSTLLAYFIGINTCVQTEERLLTTYVPLDEHSHKRINSFREELFMK